MVYLNYGCGVGDGPYGKHRVNFVMWTKEIIFSFSPSSELIKRLSDVLKHYIQ